MTSEQALARLWKLGSAQTRKTYGRHGLPGEMYGVKFGDLAKLVKEIRQDHELARELWDSGNHDARVLAAMIALGAYVPDLEDEKAAKKKTSA